MEVIFYGTRGSTPVSGREYLEYGGNTTCIAIRTGRRLLVVDCGTGMQALQRELFDKGLYRSADIFISHLHWDHIQGIAFFAPFFSPECRFSLYGEERCGDSIQEQIQSIMSSPMFPVETDAFLSDMEFHTIVCGECIRLEDIRVDTIRLSHPNVCTGYRFQAEGKRVCVIADCEQTTDEILEFAGRADLLIYDAQYTKEEYEDKKGWGHSTWEAACSFARKCRADRLILTHHDPSRTDKALETLQRRVVKAFPEAVFAYDGMRCIL